MRIQLKCGKIIEFSFQSNSIYFRDAIMANKCVAF